MFCFSDYARNFMELTNRARAELRNALIRSSGVYVFVPTNDAMQAIGYRYENYTNNQSIINMVVEMSLIQTYQNVLLTDYSGNYESFRTVRSRFNDQLVKIYTVGDDTWVEGGYVKARVVKPNIGCTNGIVHHIDAVFGVPTRDMPYTIYCEDWLVSTIIQLQFVGLASYMRDPTLQGNRRCENSASARSGVSDKFDVTDGDTDLCGDTERTCEFTFFVPNGTAIDNFGRTTHGRAIMQNRGRWRWVLQRLLTFREVIYLDGLAPGQQRVMYSDNGDEVIITTDERGNNSSGHTSDITNATFVLFEGVRAKVIHSDIGATNGVIHIIDSVLFVNDDLTRSAGSVSSQATSLLVLLLLTFSQAVWWMGRKLDGRWN
ncbi:fasciclin-1 fasciclin i fas i fcn [Plakobranchus ocellatus]|uniref:Fasciclin-1 fasciclin i fas i fcn n=1 Tax=Plakobranchus ocellatus TaxID=259542 RepID=A0AAV4BR85_9GAST|nr:fasciclin-1 fasciclin i fas i fcn [Plakobranchus ocellatus]